MRKKKGTVKNTKLLWEIAPTKTASSIDVSLRCTCCGQARLGEKVTQSVQRLNCELKLRALGTLTCYNDECEIDSHECGPDHGKISWTPNQLVRTECNNLLLLLSANLAQACDGLALIWGVSAWYENPKNPLGKKKGTYSPTNAGT